jgi:hypothetical protein
LAFFERALREDRDAAVLGYGDFALKALSYLGVDMVRSI